MCPRFPVDNSSNLGEADTKNHREMVIGELFSRTKTTYVTDLRLRQFCMGILCATQVKKPFWMPPSATPVTSWPRLRMCVMNIPLFGIHIAGVIPHRAKK